LKIIKDGLLTVFILLFLVCLCLSEDGPLSGGPCEYKKYRGRCEIISIDKKGSDSYEVKFIFHTDEEIKEAYGKVEGRQFLLLLKNSSYPKREFLKKYSIEVGRSFDCYMSVIRKGACTPIIFEFPTIDLGDY